MNVARRALANLRAEPGKLLFFIFVFLCVHAAAVGVSDDEAYYWVLGRSPAWGYAYHPPAVGWLTWFFGAPWPLVTRLPAVLGTVAILGISMRWFLDLGARVGNLASGLVMLLSFAGVFGLSWMVVPDVPMMVGYGLLFLGSWRVVSERGAVPALLLGLGSFLILLSKFSGGLAVASAFVACALMTRGARRVQACVWIGLGAALGFLPSVLWNAAHDWGSFRYQFVERHGDMHANWIRYARFWAIELALAGPLYLAGAFAQLWHARRSRRDAFLALWILPPLAIFGLQPLFSDFKVHWALMAWWPVALGVAARAALGEPETRAWRVQRRWGFTLLAIGFLAPHLPFANVLVHRLSGLTAEKAAKLDPTNDFFGWDGLPALVEKAGAGLPPRPVVGSRYQTASQAAYALRARFPELRVTLFPVDEKSRDEWPSLPEVEGGVLRAPIWFVTDNRYDQAPQFAGGRCEVVGTHEEKRGGYLAKVVRLWSCDVVR